jgi:creatinine amidohydrolase
VSSGILMEMTVEEVRAFDTQVVVLGIGSTEPHGPHLPYGTDFYQVDGLVRRAVVRANERGARALMYPTLAIGNNVNFRAWPFACRIRVQTLMNVLLDVLHAITEDGVRKIVLVNGHGGNTDCVRATLRAFTDTQPADGGAFVCMAGEPGEVGRPPLVEHSSPHGGESETSRMLYLREDLVRTGKIGVLPFGELAVEALSRDAHFVRPWHRAVPASAGGDATQASAEKGREIVERSAEHIAELIVQLSQAPWSEAFPYKV